MKTNLGQKPRLIYTPIDHAAFTVLAGAVAWVDTDVSATTGTNTNRIWFVVARCVNSIVAGARPHGSAADAAALMINSATFLTHVDNTGHADLVRGAVDIVYEFLGYLE